MLNLERPNVNEWAHKVEVEPKTPQVKLHCGVVINPTEYGYGYIWVCPECNQVVGNEDR